MEKISSLNVGFIYDNNIYDEITKELLNHQGVLFKEIPKRSRKDEKFPIEKAILDHTGKNSFQKRIESGAKVGLSICYDKLMPDEAAEIIAENHDKLEQVMLNSEFGYAGWSLVGVHLQCPQDHSVDTGGEPSVVVARRGQ